MNRRADHRRRDRGRRSSGTGAGDEITYPVELALLEAGHEPGFWDDNGRPAPWPDDIDEWSPATHEPLNPRPGEPPF